MDEDSMYSTTVVVRNDRAQAIHVMQRDCSAIFKLRPSDATIAGTYPRPDPARPGLIVPFCSAPWSSCGAFHGCHEMSGVTAYELRPGEELSFVWPGALYPVVDFPRECQPNTEPPGCDQCVEKRAAKPAHYLVEADAWSEIQTCWVPGPCPCQPFDDGTCRRQFTSGQAADLHAASSFEFPAADSVTVTFQ